MCRGGVHEGRDLLSRAVVYTHQCYSWDDSPSACLVVAAAASLADRWPATPNDEAASATRCCMESDRVT